VQFVLVLRRLALWLFGLLAARGGRSSQLSLHLTLDLVLLKAHPEVVHHLVCEDCEQEYFCDRSAEGLVELGLCYRKEIMLVHELVADGWGQTCAG